MYFTTATKKGFYHISNISPGGPFRLEVSFTGYQTAIKDSVFIDLGAGTQMDCMLIPGIQKLADVRVTAFSKKTADRLSAGYLITDATINRMPAIGRHLYDYLKNYPAAKTIAANEGGISFAGQNNRFNTLYIDGVLNNDIFGLTASGTNGGQTGMAPLSADAVEQIQLSVSPFDVSVGNFTGGSIQAITRSGSNKTESSVYHFISQSISAGAPNNPENRIQQVARTSGFRMQGAITPNSLFYFVNAEVQRNNGYIQNPLSAYRGNITDKNILQILRNSLANHWQYDAGDIASHEEMMYADRLTLRADWRMGTKNKFSVSHRYQSGQRITGNNSDAENIYFANSGYQVNNITLSSIAEWKTVIGKRNANKLSFSYTKVSDNRSALGRPFPRVRINDGDGAIHFGTDINSGINRLTQHNWALFNKTNLLTGNHNIGFGLDAEYNNISNTFMQNNFGSYSFASLADFLTNNHPSAYQKGLFIQDDGKPAAVNFSVAKASLFLSDEIQFAPAFSVTAGIRADHYIFLTKPVVNNWVNDSVLPVLANYYDLSGTRSGQSPLFPVSISPRAGFIFRSSQKGILWKGGAGIFSGRVPLAWPAGIYQYNGLLSGAWMASAQQTALIRFRSDPYQQWTMQETGATLNNVSLNLISRNFSMPSVFRASLSFEKNIQQNWLLLLEGIYSKNIVEPAYTNLNILPPSDTATGPDKRLIYSAVNNTRIPINSNGSNPFDYIILLHNNRSQTGSAVSISATVNRKAGKGWNGEISYQFAKSLAVHDGTASLTVSQWRFTESVNGRNHLLPSVSDFSTGHTVCAWIYKNFQTKKAGNPFTLSLTYKGQSGNSFSYVYGNRSMTGDDGPLGSYDLIYIPTESELANMVFLPLVAGNIFYTPEQQKEALNSYINMHSELRKKRGLYAERNGSRTPFMHRVDLKLKQTLNLLMGRARYSIEFTLEISNLGNLINPNWGAVYMVPFNQYPLIEFAGYTNGLIPQYRFNPEQNTHDYMSKSVSPTPAFSSQWTWQFGARITLN